MIGHLRLMYHFYMWEKPGIKCYGRLVHYRRWDYLKQTKILAKTGDGSLGILAGTPYNKLLWLLYIAQIDGIADSIRNLLYSDL